ncbi:tRNA modification GTPase [Sporobacter termitidis DSM 10068]|uniref:tRNA modification GTPase MnmE n=1 Tax=Sporobacter termitidis DSM 10068 TaxID=1123282 RepID=A0A1M5Y3P6_9FIRM|nr:tRNA uridine-5-carboxymethylaminomethyl(34) synthesis GTPase MnmE [Sporobacter termitidis]SHI06681.1 tRNA modification GTPase [Sporobacter termitidis DSM 10068]
MDYQVLWIIKFCGVIKFYGFIGRSTMPDTIAAIATGGAVCAVGIIRLSGPEAIAAVDRIFLAKSGIKMCDTEDRKLVYGALMGGNGAVLDLCLCTVSRGPHSYTGEDTAELHCHGSPVVLAEGMRALFGAGVRQAAAGEFTKRAFLNGRMDLSQAEAVADLIEAETAPAAQNAAGQLQGAVGGRIDAVYNALVDLSAHFFAVIDYPDEDIDDFELNNYASVLSGAETTLRNLLETVERGRVMKDGVKTAIIGRPNVGKSSLLNALVGYERAIVTPVAGTTRDTIEEKLRVGGVLLRLTDTAGIRETSDEVERLGVERARGAASGAALVVAVFDGSAPLGDDDRIVMDIAAASEKKLAVVNKSDLGTAADIGELERRLGTALIVSARTGDGVEAFARAAEKLLGGGGPVPAGEILTNQRQAEAIGQALESVGQALKALNAGVTPDAVLTEIETALAALGEVTGKTIREDIVGRIFERFCVGK